MSYSPVASTMPVGSSQHSSPSEDVTTPLGTPGTALTEPSSKKSSFLHGTPSKSTKGVVHPTFGFGNGFTSNPAVNLSRGLQLSFDGNKNQSDSKTATVSLKENGGQGNYGPIDNDWCTKNQLNAYGKVIADQKLSPTAAAFLPFCANSSVGKPPVTAKAADTTTSVLGTVSTATQLGTFSTDTEVTRAIKISGIYGIVTVEQVEDCFKGKPGLAGSKRIFHVGNEVLIRLSDVLGSQAAYEHAKTTRPDWSVEYISVNELAQRINSQSPYVSAHEGQVFMVASFPSYADRSKLEIMMIELLGLDGTIYAYQKQLASEAGTLRLVAEYCDVTCAEPAVKRLNESSIREVKMVVGLHQPDTDRANNASGSCVVRSAVPSAVSSAGLTPSDGHNDWQRLTPSRRAPPPATPTRSNLEHQDFIGNMNRMSLSNRKGVSQPFTQACGAVLSPTGRSYVPAAAYPATPAYSGGHLGYNGHFPMNGSLIGYDSPGAHIHTPYSGDPFIASNYMSSPGSGYWDSPSRTPSRHLIHSPATRFGGNSSIVRRSTATRVATRPSYNNSAGHHNVVDIARIQEGSDVRTTIMLRNIPNKIDQTILKSIIDDTSFGQYDFMYLRIDFANNCNVGYAFINFEDPYHIINFVNARSGQRWNRFNSDKVAEVSYATIQGKDCLVQKFRNSSVMLESPSYRPKIFYTKGHALVGKEEEFPEPDNASKMRRSVENAEHVGLFAPRAGQHYRDEQRRRRSQYDRGTRLAALEEFDYDESYGCLIEDSPNRFHYGAGQLGCKYYDASGH